MSSQQPLPATEDKILGVSKTNFIIGIGVLILIAIVAVFVVQQRSKKIPTFSFPKTQTETPTVTLREYRYPQTALSANDSNGYKASASSTSAATFFDAFKAFDSILIGTNNAWSSGNLKYNSSSGVYNGSEQTQTDTGNVSGEWIQLDLPQSIILFKYVMYPRLGYESTHSPRDFVLLGSTNPSTGWKVLNTQNNVTWESSSAKTFQVNVNTAFSSFRFVITKVGNDAESFGKTNADISSITLFSYTPYTQN